MLSLFLTWLCEGPQPGFTMRWAGRGAYTPDDAFTPSASVEMASELSSRRYVELSHVGTRENLGWPSPTPHFTEGPIRQPARYLLRQPGKPAFMDDRLSGNYNARRDNLTKFWRQEFGATHAVMAIRSFYENVEGPDGANVVLHFNPREPGVMQIACLYSQWSGPKTGERLLSFAAVTDEPPEEVAAAGHDAWSSG